MPDGKRKRRHHSNRARREWYARHRACRFQRRFGLTSGPDRAAGRIPCLIETSTNGGSGYYLNNSGAEKLAFAHFGQTVGGKVRDSLFKQPVLNPQPASCRSASIMCTASF